MEHFNPERPEQPKRSKKGKIATIVAGAAATVLGMNADAQIHTVENTKKKAPTEDLQIFKNVTENGKPVHEIREFRETDIKDGDTMVKHEYRVTKSDTEAVFLREHFKKKDVPMIDSVPEIGTILETQVNKNGDTEERVQVIPAKEDTFRYTQIVSGPNPRPLKAPRFLGKIKIFKSQQSKKSPDEILHEPYVSSTSMSIGEEEVPEKQPETFTNSTGPAIQEMTGDARAFIRNNTVHFSEWLKHKNNWEHLTPEQWKKEQDRWNHLKNKMMEVADYTNFEPGSHQNVIFPAIFKTVDQLMQNDITTLPGAVSELEQKNEGQ